MNTKQIRPWGNYEIFGIEPGALIKRIQISAGKRFSLQKHSKRAEKWLVVCGQGVVTVDNRRWEAGPGDFIEIAVGQIHRMQNTGKNPLVFMEVQFGNHLEENDIIRLEDDFGRISPVYAESL